jgi:hypothetical protein
MAAIGSVQSQKENAVRKFVLTGKYM